jgi:aspartate aminotransferase
MLQRAGVALVPGEAFNAPTHFRLSFAVDPHDLADGLARLRNHLLLTTP